MMSASSSSCYVSSASFSSIKQGKSSSLKSNSFILSVNTSKGYRNPRQKTICAINMAAGGLGEPMKAKLDLISQKARSVWDSSPQPVKSFPWNKAAESFIQLILDLVLAVMKYLSVPVLAVSSLSEMSYCAHERKLLLVPIPILVGVALAGILKETALELSPLLKEAEVPWHLIAVAIFFTLIKLPGPYYPYWGRILIPHIANGGLLRTLWFTFLWYRRPKKAAANPETLTDNFPEKDTA
ncbi:Embryo defective [Heracleum sosnowskyi]|uniref:Embryo defective n=1 Tax=Heracleum sosnowskyi TaxID=360622 RepID=A0AAD8H1N7_9APIA|nr:Embryo defective [Heracleum sosnowskyi]